jgi:hypothetical protein
MEALGVVFPQYQMMANFDGSFMIHIAMIKAQNCYPKRIGPNQTLVPKVLFFMFLDL